MEKGVDDQGHAAPLLHRLVATLANPGPRYRKQFRTGASLREQPAKKKTRRKKNPHSVSLCRTSPSQQVAQRAFQ
jgi:hypothetical protein